MNNFFRRTLTGTWIVLFTLGGFWLHPISFFLTGLIILTGTMLEYYKIIQGSGVKPRVFSGIISGIISYAMASLVAAAYLHIRWLLLLLVLLPVMMITELFRKEDKPFDSLAHTFFPVFYIVLPFVLLPFSAFLYEGLKPLINMPDLPFSPGLVIGFFILLWANDTGAYLAGITFGRHRLMKRISPKKSWEGFIGGVIISIVIAWFLSGWLGVVTRWQWLVVALIVSVAGTCGDLVESMLKRSMGVKDSGSVLPGHGGFLDRFDSAIISFPLVFLFI
ncbi:MAG TPA: phosphatidate cytidylyltransferase, partial [Bacteroidales bacterium]|nr:phosphatidate cytidylyltransferase [Bacteroidales bacterium]